MKLKFYVVLLTIFFSLSCLASDPALEMAKLYEESKLFDQAITEYQRYLFFNPHSENHMNLMVCISENYKKLSQVAEAGKWLQKAIDLAENSIQKDSLKLKMLPLYIAEKKYSLAEMNAVKLVYFSKDKHLIQQAYFYLGITYLYQHRWEKATEAFSASAAKPELSSQFSSLDLTDYKYKSPSKAKWLSTFIPGLGQFYAGDYKNSLNAFAVNSITVGLVTHSFIQKEYLQIFLSDLFLFERYYSGNRVRAEMAAENYNQKLDKQIFERFIELINSVESP